MSTIALAGKGVNVNTTQKVVAAIAGFIIVLALIAYAAQDQIVATAIDVLKLISGVVA